MRRVRLKYIAEPKQREREQERALAYGAASWFSWPPSSFDATSVSSSRSTGKAYRLDTDEYAANGRCFWSQQCLWNSDTFLLLFFSPAQQKCQRLYKKGIKRLADANVLARICITMERLRDALLRKVGCSSWVGRSLSEIMPWEHWFRAWLMQAGAQSGHSLIEISSCCLEE